MSNLDRFPDPSVNCAPDPTPREDREAAERDAQLQRARVALLAAQAVVLSVHRSGINLIDAVQGLETALADVEFEQERGA